ncbi:glycosyltransferase family 4 protein [Streptomyces sp. AC495_CC817]|uniref:glycosyltransferase family 4 protein n=1 Tax=Streptomyces sp. AC495_CC817 TaxID=2823900 RepID=UPI001C27F7AC|nr:glycosyltransferase family 4 protein [Streptomyces sp. AC495_CC817]
MRIVIVSRIFTPEPAAASFLLHATAEAFAEAGHEVEVLTTTVPAGPAARPLTGVRVRRAPVKRDRQGYVRGYVSYLSFDIPVFFRLMFSRRADVYLVEPPPTTGAVVRVASALRRTPYVYDAADLWSDAAGVVTSSSFVLGALRWVERFAMRGAAHAFAISQGLIDRMRQIGIATPATAVGFGTDVSAFRYSPQPPPVDPHFVYGGSYSEWHGAEVFVEAFADVQRVYPGARLTFVGNGSEQPRLRELAAGLGLSGVEFLEPVAPETLAEMLSAATASLASLRPNAGYDYAFTTKVYASLVSGCPVIFSGTGPTGPFLRGESAHHPVGAAVEWSAEAAASAMLAAADAPLPEPSRKALADWAAARFSLRAVAGRIVAGTEAVVASER